jgi:phosphoribosylglycinamide formyltransferase 1
MNQTQPKEAPAPPRGGPLRIAVLASGGGTNLQALLDRFAPAAGAAAVVRLVIASRSGIGALDRAHAAGVAHEVIDPRAHDAAHVARRTIAALDAAEIDLVVLAGYMHLVPEAVVRRFHGRMINVHPALLPSFGGRGLYGMRVHRAVLAAGARVSGATVHLVDERYDTGPILAQWPVPVFPDDAPESLAARVLEVEHRLLPAVVEALAAGPQAEHGAVGVLGFDLVPNPAPTPAALRAMIALPVSASVSDS